MHPLSRYFNVNNIPVNPPFVPKRFIPTQLWLYFNRIKSVSTANRRTRHHLQFLERKLGVFAQFLGVTEQVKKKVWETKWITWGSPVALLYRSIYQIQWSYPELQSPAQWGMKDEQSPANSSARKPTIPCNKRYPWGIGAELQGETLTNRTQTV